MEITLHTDSIIVWVMALVMIASLLIFIKMMEKRKDAKYKLEREAQDALRAERDKRQKLDYQLNRGRMIFNWLLRELKQFEDVGIKVEKIEDNGGIFSILIRRYHSHTINGYDPILQIDYDFLNREDLYKGHIFYGAYGPDILFPALDLSPKYGLDTLVLNVVNPEALRLRSHQPA